MGKIWERADRTDFGHPLAFCPEVIRLDTVDSTNSELMRRCRGGPVPAWTAVISDQQTAGRGRLDRSWQSEPGSGLWCSVLVDLSGCPSTTWLPLISGLAVLDACAGLGAAVELKWPNDITAGGKKLGGILIESAGISAHWVVGIGLNVTVAHFPDSVALADLCSPLPDTQTVFHAVLASLHAVVESWREITWDTSQISGRYQSACSSIGAQLSIARPGVDTFIAQGVGIDESGHLVIQRVGEKPEVVVAADVVHATIYACTQKNS